MTPRHAERYDRSESGLTRFARDFYSYAIDAQGRPASPLGSHVGPNTAGGLSEGGYLGFAELQYVHMTVGVHRPSTTSGITMSAEPRQASAKRRTEAASRDKSIS